MNEQAKEKLNKLKKTGKILKTVSTVAALLVVLLMIFYLLMPAGNLYLEGSDSKYGREGGYNYYGWQLTIFGCGYPPVSALAMLENPRLLAGDYIPTSYDFNYNQTLVNAVALPLIALIICGIVGGKLKNRGKAVCEVIEAAICVYSGATIVRCVELAIPMATNTGTTPFRNTYLSPAVLAGTFTTCTFPKVVCAAMICIALVKTARAAFLIYQRSTARKLSGK